MSAAVSHQSRRNKRNPTIPEAEGQGAGGAGHHAELLGGAADVEGLGDGHGSLRGMAADTALLAQLAALNTATVSDALG